MVGDAKDHNTYLGIAKLVYGDSKMWVQIFEANREVTEKLGFLPNGMSITIPLRKRAVPKLITRVKPVYPPQAKEADVYGDVVLDGTLKENGTVDQINVIDGNSQLVEAATTAVKQWQYHPSLVDRKPVAAKFVVAISFGKGGKIQF